jgi:hypothetical protein
MNVLHRCVICTGFFTECGYKIVVDYSGCSVLPAEIEDTRYLVDEPGTPELVISMCRNVENAPHFQIG